MTDPARIQRFISVPRAFFEETAGQISDVEELQVMLAFLRLAHNQGIDEPLAEHELLDDKILNDALRFDGAPREPIERIQRGINLAVARDSLLRFTVGYEHDEQGRDTEAWLLYCSPENRVRLERYRTGVLTLTATARTERERERPTVEPSRPGVFQLYEQNIGLVTPIIADRLVEALELYPESWIKDAIEESVTYNRRSWRYIQRILETWATEGRTNEADRRTKPASGTFDPERELQGKYAAVFKRQRRE